MLLFSPALAEGQDPSSSDHTEFGIAPLVGGDSDVGFGIGELSALANFKEGYQPYRWRLESALFVTFRPPAGGEGFRIPYQDVYLVLTLPDLFRKKFRLDIRPAYTRESTQKYYGIGNASQAPKGLSAEQTRYYEYDRIHPAIAVTARVPLSKGLFLEFGNSFIKNWFHIRTDSSLGNDLTNGSPTVKRYLQGTGTHAVDILSAGLIYDTRDDETATHSGGFHQGQFRFSPGGSSYFPYQYEQANLTLRFYFTPILPYLTFATRLVADCLFGNPPFYELPRFDDTFAIGGAKGVRGVPAQRYYGKAKVFGNLEVRSELLPFKVWSKDFVLGAAAFFDAGRLWADYRRQPEFDGTGIGLKYGAGGGLRLQQGKTFVVRAEIAWSPDAQPIGVYFEAGQIF